MAKNAWVMKEGKGSEGGGRGVEMCGREPSCFSRNEAAEEPGARLTVLSLALRSPARPARAA